MVDNRSVAAILDEQRQRALEGRLRVFLRGDVPDLEGVPYITARDIAEVFEEEFEADYGHKAELETPAHLVVDMVCLNCHQVIPDVAATLSAKTTIEKEGVSKVALKLTSNVRTHTCGQISIPRPVAPEVVGQEAVFDDDDLLPGEPDEGDGA